MSGKTPVLICAALGVVLAAVWTLVGSDAIDRGPVGPSLTAGFAAPGPDAASGTGLQDTLEELQRALAVQDERIARLEAQLAAAVDQPAAVMSLVADAAATALSDEGASAATDSPRPPRGPATVAMLIEQGFAEADASQLVADLDALKLERLQIMYQANRPGGADTNELSSAMQALPSERQMIEERFGEEGYEKYLYASERPNRLVVQDVLNNSPAAAIGLKAGDQLISAANRRIYSVGDLMRAAASATGGQMALVIRRGDALIESTLPAGPLGVTTSLARIDPNPAIR